MHRRRPALILTFALFSALALPAAPAAAQLDPSEVYTEPAVAALDTEARETDGAGGFIRFPFQLSSAAPGPVTIRFETLDGTASAPFDYLARLGSVTIAPGQRDGFVDVPVVGDDLPEQPEAFAVAITGVTGAGISRRFAAGVIADDDAADAPAATDTSKPRVRFAKLRLRGRRVVTRVRCPKSEQTCRGRLTLFAVRGGRARKAGTKAYRLRGSQARTIKVQVRKSVLRKARRRDRVRIRGVAITQDAAGNVATRTLRATLRYRKSR